MAEMTSARRSAILARLLREQEQRGNFRGNQTGLEAGLRGLGKYLNKQKIEELQEQEKASAKTQGASEAALLSAMNGGGAQDFSGRPIVDEAGVQKSADPQAQLTQLLTQHPDSQFGQMAAQMQLEQAFATPKPPEAPKTRNRTDGEETVVEEWDPSKGAWSEVSRGPRYKPGTEVIVNNNPEAPPSKIAAWAEDIALLDEDMRKTEILMKMDPKEFLTYWGRGKKGFIDFTDKLGLTSKEQQQWAGKAQTFKGLTEQIFQGIRREVTGAQAAKIELDVLEQAFLSTKMGPAQYQAALTLIGEMQQGIRDVKQSLIEDGITPDNNPALFARQLDRAISQYSGMGGRFAEEATAAAEEQMDKWGIAIGTIEQGMQYQGGDPSDPNSWQTVEE